MQRNRHTHTTATSHQHTKHTYDTHNACTSHTPARKAWLTSTRSRVRKQQKVRGRCAKIIPMCRCALTFYPQVRNFGFRHSSRAGHLQFFTVFSFLSVIKNFKFSHAFTLHRTPGLCFCKVSYRMVTYRIFFFHCFVVLFNIKRNILFDSFSFTNKVT